MIGKILANVTYHSNKNWEMGNCMNNDPKTEPISQLLPSFQGSKYSSKYETSSRSTSYGRDRDRDSPIGMNGYRSVSPDIDSPRDRGDRDRDRDRYQSSNYLKRDRDYKKDKYSGKYFHFSRYFSFQVLPMRLVSIIEFFYPRIPENP